MRPIVAWHDRHDEDVYHFGIRYGGGIMHYLSLAADHVVDLFGRHYGSHLICRIEAAEGEAVEFYLIGSDDDLFDDVEEAP